MRIFTWKKEIGAWGTTGIFALLIFVSSCTKYSDPPPYFQDYDSTQMAQPRKVLLICVDGMAGQEIKKIQPPYITKMLAHSKYSWRQMNDAVSTDASTWESMMTGVPESKHQVRDSSFEASADSEHIEEVIPVYPTILNRLLALKPEMKTYAVSPWKQLNDRLLAEVNTLVTAPDDRVVKDSVINELKNRDASLIIVNFNAVNIAGKTYGYSADVSQYKQAVLTTDAYIKDIMNALESRPDYSKEEWLVIVTSNHGGMNKSYGGNTVKERQVFTAYYNSNFEPLEISGYNYSMGVPLSGSGSSAINAIIPDDKGLYNFGSSGDYTVSLRGNFSSKGTYNPAFFSKTNLSYGNTSQWAFMFQGGNEWRVILGSSGKSLKYLVGENIALNEWHTLTLKIYSDSGKRMAAVYTDGKMNASADITGYDISNSSTVKLGYVSGYLGNPAKGTFSDVRIWSTALPDSVIANMACQTKVDPQSPYYKDLIAYWPCDDGTGGEFIDQSPLKNNFELQGNYKWNLVNAFEGCTVTDQDNPGDFAITDLDIVPQILYWLRVDINKDWGLQGIVWLSNFEQEFIKEPKTK